MAKKSTKIKQKAPSSLTIRLFDPGMSILHRAGLGGLACTLHYIERAYDMGILLDDDIPGGPWVDGTPPWSIEPLQVTLDFGEPEKAGEYIHRLFKIAFQVKDGLIYLPAQYLSEPPISVRAELQKAIQLTFLQHGPSCGSREGARILSFEVDDGIIDIDHQVFSSFKHQGWYWLNRTNKKDGN